MIDPVAIQLGPLSIYWYGIAWAVSFMFILYVPSHYVKKASWSSKWEDIVSNTMIAIIVGGRLGSMLIYQRAVFMSDPLAAFRLWEGGMSFYGAAISGGLYIKWYTRRHKIDFFALSDAALIHLPLPIFLVRIANFINGELWGRVTDQSWGYYFPKSGSLLRHPSQLYEAVLEGLVLWCLVYLVSRQTNHKGYVTTTFVIGYGVFRCWIETYFREPSYELSVHISTGQLFSILFICFGLLVAMTVAKEANKDKG